MEEGGGRLLERATHAGNGFLFFLSFQQLSGNGELALSLLASFLSVSDRFWMVFCLLERLDGFTVS